MKRRIRNPEKFDVLELFASMATEYGYDLSDPVAESDFVERVRSSIAESKKSKITVFGKRIESLFAYVSGALGKTQLIKQEDAGELYFDGEEIIPPDYRLTLLSGDQLFVEVKNFHQEDPHKEFSIRRNYYRKLKKYCEVNGLELFIALYFSAWNRWSLLPIESFNESESKYSIDFMTAIAKSEMAMLGDCVVATSPDLELHLIGSPEEASEIDSSGKVQFVTRKIRIYCAGQEVTDEEEKRIAFYLIRFGDWVETKNEPMIEDNKLHGIKFVFSPENKEDYEQQGFAMIGNLSTMVSNGFREMTVKDGEVESLTLGIDPVAFSALIPEDYKGSDLPIWRFVIQSNAEFKK